MPMNGYGMSPDEWRNVAILCATVIGFMAFLRWALGVNQRLARAEKLADLQNREGR
jgi:hypothetical protein